NGTNPASRDSAAPVKAMIPGGCGHGVIIRHFLAGSSRHPVGIAIVMHCGRRHHRAHRRTAMKFGIFYELQLPRPWLPGGEWQLYQNALDQVELADRLGYDYAWEVEHHFLEEYSHSPAPEVFLSAASQRTRNIRLGHGIVQLTTNPPQRVAERIACLDPVANGRV